MIHRVTGPIERTFLAADGDAVLLAPSPVAASAYHALTPAPALHEHVDRMHLGDERVAAEAAFDERVLPDGAVQLVFNFGDIPAIVGDRSAPPLAGDAMAVVGAACAAAVIRMAGHVQGAGVRLRPGGVAAVLGVPAGELAGRSVPLEALWGAAAHELLERLAGMPHGPRRMAVLERVLLQRIRRAGAAPHAGAAEAVRRIRQAGGRITVRELAATLGVGERRLEQLFHQHVGLPPKAACRLARFHASVRLLRREPARRWSEIAHHAGFADQPHLVHEFRALAGLTPRDFRARLGFGFPQDPAPSPR